jgi:hypothetical protein
MFKVPENFRIKSGDFASNESYGNTGAFMLPLNNGTIKAFCIVSDGEGWEHVSITLGTKKGQIKRCPTWDEMCAIKSIFWDEDDCVIQFHPSKADYISNNNYCLHLWRPIDQEIPRPHYTLVGLK